MAGIVAFHFASSPVSRPGNHSGSGHPQSIQAEPASRAVNPLASRIAAGASLDEFERLLHAEALDASLVEQVIRRIHSADLSLALTRAQGASDGVRHMLISALLARIAEEDAGAAVQLASNLREVSSRNEELEKQLQKWLRVAPTEATKWAEAQLNRALLDAMDAASNPADDRDREEACIAIAKGWALVDPAAASQWVQNLPDSHQRLLALQAIYSSWAASDVTSACAAAGLVSDPDLRSKLYTEIGSRWAKSDAGAALAWMQSLPSDESIQAFRSVLLHLSQSAPAEAMNRALALQTQGASETVSFLLQQWSARDATGAAQWLKTLPAGPRRDAALADLLPAWAAADPKAAASEVLAAANAESRVEMLNVVAASWAKKDPAAAMTWALKSQDADVMNAGVIQSIITQWTARGTDAVASWLDTLPQSGFRDDAIAAFARNIGGEHPQTALAWANTITESTRRSEVLQGIALRWLEEDESAARPALAALDLPTDVRERIDTVHSQ